MIAIDPITLSMRFLVPLLICLGLVIPRARSVEVTLTQDDQFFHLANGDLAVAVRKSTGRVTSAVLTGQELLGEGGGYWSMTASSSRSRVEGFGKSVGQSIGIDPKTNGGARGEVVCEFHGNGTDGGYPGASQIRYGMDRDSATLYATAVMDHRAGDAPFRIGEGRFVMKLDGSIFNHLVIDKDRNRLMPSGRDWDQGSPLNLKEARRMTTGVNAGWAEHKYGYSAMLGQTPAYGWLGTQRRFGVWMINPSTEYIAGGPTKMELTGHLDVGGNALPTLLNMWHGSHYGGTSLGLNQDENWSKVIGPFAIHFNRDGSPEELWKSALVRAEIERRAWPYAWVAAGPVGPVARGGISGRIVPEEKPAAACAGGAMWVGLTAADYSGSDRWNRGTVGWQRDGKFYQYWVRAAADGSFSLTGVRPGTYVLRAFVDGILGEYARPDVTVVSGTVAPLGEIPWLPERAGPTLWEIGLPNRSAAEFLNGDRYWHWGNYLKFKTDFPQGVNYVVGKSDWRKDWNICQPLDLSANCEVLGDSTWTIRFPLESVPAKGARLRISFCGSREGSSIALLLNGGPLGTTGPLPEDGAMHRDSHRGMWFERSFDIPADRLNESENVLQLRLKGTEWHQGVLYDYLRLEAMGAAPSPP